MHNVHAPLMTQTQNRDIYEVDELASRLGICRQAIYRGLREGTIPSIRLGKRFIIPRSAVNEWLSSAAARPRQTA